jgi:predicted O-linked N-acetylglucosamine transferase (SPINDLY family)
MKISINQLFQHAVTAQKQGQWKKVIHLLQTLLQAEPNHEQALHLMGLAKSIQQDHQAAEKYVLKSIHLSESQENLNTLGIIYLRQGQILKAIKYFKKALTYNNKSSKIYNNLAQSNLLIGNSHEAINNYHIALSIRSDRLLISNYLLGLNYVSFLSPEQIFQAHAQYARYLNLKVLYKHHSMVSKEKIRIGYVSGSFRQNSIRFFLLPVLKNFDRNKFITCCYSDTLREDEITDEIKTYVSEWTRTLHMSHDEMASKIFQDKIDILVDLSGHMSGNRLPVFAKQPARIQVTWLGYPNTTGLQSIHYRFTDAVADPPTNDAYYTEKLIRLSPCFLSYQPDKNSPEVSPLPSDTTGVFTFGSFNNLAKMNESVIKLWSDILKSLPETRLLIKANPLSDIKIQEFIINKFKSHGVKNEIKCSGFIQNMQSHLSMYHQIDLALDPFPYNGTTTTCDALLMGVPVLTRCGKMHASRVGASLLSCIGLNDFIAYSDADYVSKAIYLYHHPYILSDLRKKLRHICLQSVLMNGARFTHSLEAVYYNLICNDCEKSNDEINSY